MLPKEIKKISDVIWEIPKTFKQGMRVPARIYATEKILKGMDNAVFDQITNVATLPGIQRYAYCMPDGHSGYGFPIGGVAAFDTNEGVISPGGIGFDISCGMRLLLTNLTYKDVKPHVKELVNQLFERVPAGVGSRGFVKLNPNEFRKVVEQGTKWCIDNGYGWKEDLERIELNGCMEGADSSKISERAVQRGLNQIGTLGSGNHYCEIQHVKEENIFDKDLSKRFGIFPDQIVIMFHCLPGDAKVLTEHGCWIKIKDLENKKLKVKCFDITTHEVLDTEIDKFYKVNKKERLYKLKTKTGKEIIATEDHPILTKDGLKFINDIKEGELVAVSPFEGVKYEQPTSTVIVGENNIRKIHNSDKLIGELKEKGLLPLRMDSWQLPYLAKLLGYITGDGTVRKSGRGWRTYILGDEIDLLKIKEDISRLGFKTSKVYKKKTKGIITNQYGKRMLVEGDSNHIECNSSALVLLLISMGASIGKKTTNKFLVPKWMMKSPKWIKRLYLASYFGAELTKPMLSDGVRFERPSLAVYKIKQLENNGRLFLKQIVSCLREFGIEAKIVIEEGGGRITKSGKTVKLVLRVSSDMANNIKFLSTIGYEYCGRKQILGSHALSYLQYRYALLLNESKLRNKPIDLVKNIESKRRMFQIPIYNEFINPKRYNPPTPVMLDEVEQITKLKNKEKIVYDLKIKNSNHNFIANNFVVGNCGSRGFGHEVASNYLQLFLNVMESKYKIKILDRELACAPFNSKEGQDYFSAMKCGVNMSFANRQTILHRIREVFSKVFKQDAEKLGMKMVFDISHNRASLEKHKIDGSEKEVIVHRKGATASYGPGRIEIPKLYRDAGIPVIIGGSMETGSYLLVGTESAKETFYSTCHGSGRTMSRTQARKSVRGDKLQKDMEQKGIYVKTTSFSGLAEEAGFAYKDIDEVIDAADKAGISKPVVKLIPLGNVKG